MAVLQVGAAMSFMLCLVQLLFSCQDGHKNTIHSKLNDSTCADFLVLRNLDNYQ